LGKRRELEERVARVERNGMDAPVRVSDVALVSRPRRARSGPKPRRRAEINVLGKAIGGLQPAPSEQHETLPNGVGFRSSECFFEAECQARAECQAGIPRNRKAPAAAAHGQHD
jgi:hypothetical protein